MNKQNKQTDLEKTKRKNEIDRLIEILAAELEQDLDNTKYKQSQMVDLFFETDRETKEEWADNFLDYHDVIFPEQLEELENFNSTYLEEIAEEYMKEFWRLNYQDNKILTDFLCDSFYAWYEEGQKIEAWKMIPDSFSKTKQLATWYMKKIQKRSNEKIAFLLDVTESTVRDHYCNAEKQLKKEAERAIVYQEYLKES